MNMIYTVVYIKNDIVCTEHKWGSNLQQVVDSIDGNVVAIIPGVHENALK